MFPSFCLISFPYPLFLSLFPFVIFSSFFPSCIPFFLLSPFLIPYFISLFWFFPSFPFFFYPSPPLLVFVFTCLSVTLLNPDSQIGRFLSCGLNGKCVCVRIWLPADSSSVVLVLCFLLNLPFLSFFRKCC